MEGKSTSLFAVHMTINPRSWLTGIQGVRTLKWVKDEIKQKGQHMIENVEKKIKHDGGDGDWYGDDEGEGGVETEV